MPADAEIQSYDPLSYALESLGSRALVYARVEASGNWGIDMPPGAAYFHALVQGTALVTTDDRCFELGPGDLLIGLCGERHQVLSAPTAEPVKLERLVKTRWSGEAGVLRLGDTLVDAILACGTFSPTRLRYEDVLGPVPNHLVLRASEHNALDPIGMCLALLQHEVRGRSAGCGIACARLMDLLLTLAVRRWMETSTTGAGWQRALQDRYISRALEILHGDLRGTIDVPDLASRVGLSRSAFTSRFVQLVGEPPARYTLRHRMRVARSMLLAGKRVGEVALALGYESDSAFSRAYRKVTGEAPSAFRRQHEFES